VDSVLAAATLIPKTRPPQIYVQHELQRSASSPDCSAFARRRRPPPRRGRRRLHAERRLDLLAGVGVADGERLDQAADHHVAVGGGEVGVEAAAAQLGRAAGR
jgi:hypothetical protein